MPRHSLPKAHELIVSFCKEHDLKYHEDDLFNAPVVCCHPPVFRHTLRFDEVHVSLKDSFTGQCNLLGDCVRVGALPYGVLADQSPFITLLTSSEFVCALALAPSALSTRWIPRAVVLFSRGTHFFQFLPLFINNKSVHLAL